MHKILIADYEKDIVTMLKCYFEMNGYEVIDGAKEVSAAMRTPDLILLDINMPECDGLEVCRKICDYVSCPILLLTAQLENSNKIK